MKIVCIGRNYADHAKELNNPVPKQPVIFCKPDSSIIQKGKPFFYPNFSKNIHYEVEIVIRINRLGKHIAPRFAHKYYNEITLGIDFTARDIQLECKNKGLPWERAKSFDGSAPIGRFIELSEVSNPINNLNFTLLKNGQPVQIGCTKNMLFSVDQLIAEISKIMTLKIGDLIFTGTPVGVGPVAIGDVLIGKLEGKEILKVPIK
jgi:acylpyruvate hydrolase